VHTVPNEIAYVGSADSAVFQKRVLIRAFTESNEMNNRDIYSSLINALGRMADRIDHDVVLRTNRLYTLADSQQRKFLDAMSIEIFGKRLKDLGLSDE
jgi:hypothetical protein